VFFFSSSLGKDIVFTFFHVNLLYPSQASLGSLVAPVYIFLSTQQADPFLGNVHLIIWT